MADYPKPITSVDDLPKNYDALPRERFWQQYWLEHGTYRFQPTRPDGGLRTRDEIFSIDTPPPTVSGNLHIGHVYSYTQTDMNARYRRMTGKHVFYPFGFDDNGLPTERLVEKERGIRAHEVSREDFIAMCQETAAKYEAEFIELWKSLALSCDWEQYYTTINERSRAISQASFIDLYNKGYIYRKVAPTQWDWVNQTAIAQAEIEDREVPGHFHYIKFQWADGPGQPVRGEFVIGTTRPELIPACVAVMANPESDQPVRDHEGKPVLDFAGNVVLQRDLIGKIAITPLFEVEVPILPSEKADPEKGTGVLMCCTFGDQEDVEHWERFNLPTRVIFGKDGRIELFDTSLESMGDLEPEWPSRNGTAAVNIAQQLYTLKIKQGREKIRELLSERQLMLAVTDVLHTVRHAERGDVPVEILLTPQWYVNLLDHKQQLLEQGRKVQWHPQYMQKRYEQWVDGLNSDWCISRQRYNGVPFPVWYSKPAGNVHLAALSELPVNPLSQPHPADVVMDMEADRDVMDTWATSSVTPLLNTHYMPGTDGADTLVCHPGKPEDADKSVCATGGHGTTERHKQLFPYDMRPQAHDIIRTWAFYTIAKAYFHFGEIPWQDIVISGHAQDASRAKMSKSKGNTVTPAQMVEKYSADGLRYWSGSVKLGTDTIYDETKLGEGRKLINKLFNATKFALRHLLEFDPTSVGVAPARPSSMGNESEVESSTQEGRAGATPTALTSAITYPTDLWLISRLNACIEKATAAHEAFEFGDAKQAIEDFFWADLCDNYLEFSKGRLYGEPLAVEAHVGESSSGAGLQTRENGRSEDLPHWTADQLRASAQATLYLAFSSVLRMLAPALPHITEECWSWYFAQHSERGSVHLEDWPQAVGVAPARPAMLTEASTDSSGRAGATPTVVSAELLIHTVSAVRKWKSERGVSIKTPLSMLSIYRTDHAPKDRNGEHTLSGADLHAVLGDLMSTCNAQQAFMVAGDPPADAVTTERGWVAVTCEIVETA